VWAFGIVVIETVYKTYPFDVHIKPYTENSKSGKILLKSYKSYLKDEQIPNIQIQKVPRKWKKLISKKNPFLPWPNLLGPGDKQYDLIQHFLIQQLVKKLLKFNPKNRWTIEKVGKYISTVINISNQIK